jgi:hypothetical protein
MARAHASCVLVFLGGLYSAAGAQDLIHYKFEELGGRQVTNFAAPDRRVPRDGTLASSAGYAQGVVWAPGRFGSGALRGVPQFQNGPTLEVDTGWDGRIELTAFTVALFVRNRFPTSVGSLLFHNGRYLQGWVGTPSGAYRGFSLMGLNSSLVSSNSDVFTAAQSRWVHVALVVQANGAAQFFIDGNPEPPIAVLAPNIQDGVRFRVGMASAYDLDEFRFTLRAASAAEIQSWATRDLATDAPFSRGCAPRGFAPELDSNRATAGPPRVGNQGHAYLVFGPSGSAFALAIGLTRLSLGGVPLPIDLGLLWPGLSGCPWETSTDLVLGGALDAAGRGALPFPIPADPTLVGSVLYNQCLLAHPTVAPVMTTNAFASAIGN